MKTKRFIKEVKLKLSSGKEDLNYKMDADLETTYPFIVNLGGIGIGCIYLFSPPSMREGLVDIMHFRVYNSRKGCGSKLLTILSDLADKHEVILSVYPVSDGKPDSISIDDLKDWYRKFGFVGDVSMEREPNK